MDDEFPCDVLTIVTADWASSFVQAISLHAQDFLKVRNHVMLSAVLQARSIPNPT